MKLFLSEDWQGFAKSKKQTHEIRGGKYAARVQIGYEKDGSPKYRYFESQDEYESYLQGRKGKKKSDDSDKKKKREDLKDKTKEEGKEHSKKQQSLFKEGKKKKKQKDVKVSKKDTEVSKSLRLYLEVE